MLLDNPPVVDVLLGDPPIVDVLLGDSPIVDVLLDDPPVLDVLLAAVVVSEAFSVLKIPPWTWAGTLWPVAIEAAFLNAARVSGPLVLRAKSAFRVYISCLVGHSCTYGGLITPTMPALQCPI